jgi:tight adherence protein C
MRWARLRARATIQARGNAAAVVLPSQYSLACVVAGAVFAILAFALPRAWIVARARSRAHRIEIGLPFAVDLLTLSVGAGQNVPGALQRVARDIGNAHPILAEELKITCRQADLRDLSFALDQWADRVWAPSARNLAMVLSHSQRAGTDASAALTEFSAAMRTTQRQRAEARANRLGLWMLFPTLGCLWLGVAILLLGPPLMELTNRSALREAMGTDAGSSADAVRRTASALPISAP